MTAKDRLEMYRSAGCSAQLTTLMQTICEISSNPEECSAELIHASLLITTAMGLLSDDNRARQVSAMVGLLLHVGKSPATWRKLAAVMSTLCDEVNTELATSRRSAEVENLSRLN